MMVYMVMIGIYSLIPYKGPASIFFSSPLNFMYMSFHLLGMFVMFVDGFEDVITEVC